MNPFKRIKIGDRIINLEHVVAVYQTKSGEVFVGTDLEDWAPNCEDGKTFWNYFLRWGQAIKVGEFAVNKKHITTAYWVTPSQLHVCVSCKRLNPFILSESNAQEFWEDYSSGCIDLTDYQPPRA